MDRGCGRRLPSADNANSYSLHKSCPQRIPRGLRPYSFHLLGEVLDGSLCPAADDLAQQLARHLLLLYEEHPCLLQSVANEVDGKTTVSPRYTLEIEGRLGVLREIGGKTRLQIPTISHTVLAPAFCRGGTRGVDASGGGWVHFDAGVSSQQFADLRGALLDVISRQSKACARQMQVILALMGEEIQDGSCDMAEAGSDSDGDATGCDSVLGKSVHLRSSGDTGGVGTGLIGLPPSGSEIARVKGSHKSIPSPSIHQLRGNDWTVLPVRETEEVYFRVEAIDASARFTSVKQPSARAPIHPSNLTSSLASPGIYKKNIVQWNIYTGADKEDAFRTSADLDGSSTEDAAKTKLDYRLALNFENNIDVRDLQRALLERQSGSQGRIQHSSAYRQTLAEPQLRRQRARQSLVHRSGLRIDLTRVVQHQGVQISGSSDSRRGSHQQTLYEVEVELHPSQVARVNVDAFQYIHQIQNRIFQAAFAYGDRCGVLCSKLNIHSKFDV